MRQHFHDDLAVDCSAPGNSAVFDTSDRSGGPVYALVNLTALTGTNITFTLEHSGNGTDWVTREAYTALSATGTKGNSYAGILRYVRFSWVETAVSAATASFHVHG